MKKQTVKQITNKLRKATDNLYNIQYKIPERTINHTRHNINNVIKTLDSICDNISTNLCDKPKTSIEKELINVLADFLMYYESDNSLSWGSLSQDARAILAAVGVN